MNTNERNARFPMQQNAALDLTPEEQAVLQECRSESFWQRSLPLMALSCGLFHYAVKMGKAPPSAYLAKQFFIATSSFMAGKFSYVSVCKEKALSRLPPDSNIVRAFKGEKVALPQPTIPPQVNESANYSNQQIANQAPMQTNQPGSYDDLRRRNREAAMMQERRPQQQAPVQDTQANVDRMFDVNKLPPAPPSKPMPPSGDTRKYRTNQYGDIIYEE